ncbi:hypothetical protein FUA23_01310 [Neolewinella aurantiaca]|uniref:Uncharacterized protein n=1 Tax=Neolewinella aurantiaca TaxID=2602767 RepID=A0A5C7FMM3_9BACT|nr:hypothetical protein [Neolewinella aurantiaca]TXF91364.1 hypothetical protein FUA23_01310 [Neolewinella aurantiaca]
MLPRTFLLLLMLCSGLFLIAQNTDQEMGDQRTAQEIAGDLQYLLEASRLADTARYEGIRGTPYRYEQFGALLLFDTAMNPYPVDKANYNGFSNQFEFYHNGKLREINGNNFMRVEVLQAEGPDHIYVRGLNRKFPSSYARVIFQGDNIVATLIYNVINDEKVVENPGQTLKLRRFSAKSLYYAMVDGEFVTLKLSAKALAESLGHPAELRKFIKAQKLKPGRDEDLIKIFEKADELF